MSTKGNSPQQQSTRSATAFSKRNVTTAHFFACANVVSTCDDFAAIGVYRESRKSAHATDAWAFF